MKNKPFDFEVTVSEEPITEANRGAQERALDLVVDCLLKSTLKDLTQQDLGKEANELMARIFENIDPDVVNGS